MSPCRQLTLIIPAGSSERCTGHRSRTWKVEVTSPSLRGFRRLPEKATAAIVEFVTGVLADNPYRLSKPLTNELLGQRTARRGAYRVLFTLDVEDRILYVHSIKHRSGVSSRVSRSSRKDVPAGSLSPRSGVPREGVFEAVAVVEARRFVGGFQATPQPRRSLHGWANSIRTGSGSPTAGRL